MARFLLIPIEVANRELNSRFEIAEKIVDLGFIPIIGPKDVVQKLSYSLKSSKGFLDKGYDARSSDDLFKKIIESQGFIYSLDEEGAVDIPIADFLNKRYSQRLFDYADIIFFWGGKQFERFKSRSKSHNKLVVSGNPRFVKKVKIDFKKNNQITIVTNCGWGNNISGIEWVRKNYASRSKYLEEIIYNDQVKIKIFTKLIKHLSTIKLQVILRPHHEENISFWRNLLLENKIDNIKIDSESNINKIIDNSSCIFHCDSTVAIDANIKGIPVISLNSDELKVDYLAKIAIDISSSINVNRVKEFKSLDSITTYGGNNKNQEILHDFFNISKDQKNPVDLICHNIQEIQYKDNSNLLILLHDFFLIFYIQILKNIKYIFYPNRSDAEKVYALKHKFFWRKFPILSFVKSRENKRNYSIIKFGKCLIFYINFKSFFLR